MPLPHYDFEAAVPDCDSGRLGPYPNTSTPLADNDGGALSSAIRRIEQLVEALDKDTKAAEDALNSIFGAEPKPHGGAKRDETPEIVLPGRIGRLYDSICKLEAAVARNVYQIERLRQL